MTGKPLDFGPIFKARLEQRGKALAEKRQDLAEHDRKASERKSELCELEKLLAEVAEFEQALDKALNWPRDEPVGLDWVYDKKNKQYKKVLKYGRAPRTWKARHGYEFYSDVRAIQARDKCSVADAIRKLKKAEPKKWSEKQRILERRFQETKRYWESWHQTQMMLEARIRDALDRT